MSHALGVPAFGGDQESRSAVLFEADAGAAGTPSASGGVAGDAAAVVPCAPALPWVFHHYQVARTSGSPSRTRRVPIPAMRGTRDAALDGL
jgi:hypothetical protein